MQDTQARKVMGCAGVVIGLGVTLTIPLFFVYSGPPPAWNVLTRDLINLIVSALLIVFIACFSSLIRREDAASEWLASIFYGAGLLFVGVNLVSTALEAGVIFGRPDGTLDPTIDGPLADANVLIHGSIKRLLTVVILVPAGYAVLRTKILPAWVAWSAYIIALVNLAFVPSLYFGRDVNAFYSAIGWGNSAFVASFLGYWVLAVGVAALRHTPPAAPE